MSLFIELNSNSKRGIIWSAYTVVAPSRPDTPVYYVCYISLKGCIDEVWWGGYITTKLDQRNINSRTQIECYMIKICF